MKKTIYLAGRMDGLTENEAMDWRYRINGYLNEFYNIRIPLFNPLIDNNNSMWDMDYYWLDNSDIIIANFDYESNVPFLGTSMEIARAYYQNKPIIIFSSKKWVKESITLKYHATAIVSDLEKAIEIAKLLL